MTDATDLSSTYSTYAARTFAARPALAAALEELAGRAPGRAWMEQRLDELGARLDDATGAVSETQLRQALRQLRAEVFCIVMCRDLAGRAAVAEVTAAMTDLAELGIQRSLAVLEAALTQRYGTPLTADGSPQTLGVVGMGKLGGRELNVSSDVDLIFIYEEEGETAGGERASISCQEYFTLLGRRLIGALSEVTADGYVFRVDMRLRPNGDAGPLACSLAMLEEYFYVQGREWERYAWVKGRLVSESGSAAAGRLARQLDALTVPFVYRRYLDYGAIGAIRSLHLQIRQEAGRRAARRPDQSDDVKLGRGGIRELEFSAQVFQLIRGGQDAGFRVRPTLAVLAHATSVGLMSADLCARLTSAYLFLRQVEHRLQYLNDAQTHALPVDPGARLKLASSLGFDDYGAFLAALDVHRNVVEQQFDEVFADKNPEQRCAADDDRNECAGWIWSSVLAEEGAAAELLERLGSLGFGAPAALSGRLRAVWESNRYANLPSSSRERFDLLLRRGLGVSSGIEPAADREETMSRFLDLLEAVSGRGAYLALLTEFPAALRRVLRLLHASRWAADYLIRHPQLLDELLDDEALATPFDWDGFKRTLRAKLAAADGVEQQMDLLRHAHQAEVFRILLLDLDGQLSVEQIGDVLSFLADAILDVTLEAVWRHLPRHQRETPRFAVIAYGKLGGKELGYASDLDLIFLYDESADPAHPDEEGMAAQMYANFARRLITWMTTATGAGRLFDVDLRLRPNGAAGLMVTDIAAFRRYQMREGANSAWVWEHQALSRARYCAGDPAIGAAFEAVRERVLALPRDAESLAREIVEMRGKVLNGHPNRTALFDLKHDRGGMVDIEFMVQYLILLHAPVHAELIRNTGNIGLLRELARLGLITVQDAAVVGDAYRTYRALQHKMRLDGLDAARVAPERVASERSVVLALWQRLFGG